MLESKIEVKCCEYALSKGVRSSKLGQQGDPDRIFWVPYEQVFVEICEGAYTERDAEAWLVEFKRPGGVVSKLQETKIKWLEKAGFIVDIIYSFEEFVEKLEGKLK